MRGMTVCIKNIANNMQSIQSIVVENPGSGYTVAPGIAVTAVDSSGGSGVIGTVHIGDGTLGVVTVTDGGGGFSTSTPTVAFSTPLSFTNTGIGTTATGVAVVSAAGTVTSIRYTNAGAGYTAGDLPISVTISSPSN